MVEMKNDGSYPLVYSLVTLALILPVATAIIVWPFSAMNTIKNRLRNRMGDQWINDCLERYIQDYWAWKNHAAVSKYKKSSRAIK